MNTFADQSAQHSIQHLDLQRAVLIGFSMGGGEVARYIGRYGTKHIAKAVLVAAVPPLMLKTDANPGGLPKECSTVSARAFSPIAHSSSRMLRVARSLASTAPVPRFPKECIDSWWMQGMMGGHKNTYECINAFSETDFTEDLKKFDLPTPIIHRDDDQVVPIDASARASAKIVRNAKLIVYPGAPHGITDTHKDRLNGDLLTFLKA